MELKKKTQCVIAEAKVDEALTERLSQLPFQRGIVEAKVDEALTERMYLAGLPPYVLHYKLQKPSG
jgi:hypothetical protein